MGYKEPSARGSIQSRGAAGSEMRKLPKPNGGVCAKTVSMRCLLLALCALASVPGVAQDRFQSIPEAATSAEVRVVMPDGRITHRQFDRAAEIAKGPRHWLGTSPADGLYRYEIRFAQALSEVQRAAAAQARAEGGTAFVEGMPEALAAVSGSFRVQGGEIQAQTGIETNATAARPKSGETPNDQVIPDDLIVQSSLCVGLDCVNNESFGFDTIRMKENNTRIKFEDTSTGTFPADDWQLTANDDASNGLNRFSIENITAATVPFTVQGSAPNNSLYINANGDVGLGTAVPGLKLSLSDTDTPSIRLEQTGAGGFTPQTWDMAGNEAGFFVRDVTAGSLLSFRIRPGAPGSSLDIAANGSVGIGTGSPQARPHVEGDAYVAGTLTQLSSRSAKTNLVAVAGDAVLEQLSRLPLWTWNYLNSNTGDTHIGPVAEDFYAAFGFGTSARQLAPSDVAGVALAATKALQQEIEVRDQTIASLEARLARLEKLLGGKEIKGTSERAAD